MSKSIAKQQNKQKWSRVVLFHAAEHTEPYLLWGEPVNTTLDVGLALASQPPADVKVRVWKMANPEDVDAEPTEEILTVKTLFCPIDTKRPRQPKSAEYRDSATRTHNVSINKTTDPACSFTQTTTLPEFETKGGPQLQRPSRRSLTLPDLSQCPDSITFSPAIKDHEEMIFMLQFTILMGQGDGPITKDNAMEFVAGYTLAMSAAVRPAGGPSDSGPGYHGIDAFCPFGPVLVSPDRLPDPAEMTVKAVINGEEKEIQAQGATLKDVHSSVMHCINVGRGSQGGGLVMNGTPAGHLGEKEPAIILRKGDRLVVKASHGIGHLTNSIYHERVPPLQAQ